MIIASLNLPAIDYDAVCVMNEHENSHHENLSIFHLKCCVGVQPW